MQTFKKILACLFFTVISLAYNSACAETAEVVKHDSHHAANSLDWPGVYYGFTPCADCKGVKTSLALNSNHSYILITQFVGKSEREFVEKGKFAWSDESNMIFLTPRNSTITKKYFVGENILVQLDEDGNRISGKLADRYILRRTDVTKPKTSHSPH
jgi:uncharacterized lipoprotein NlpE involved in copper resistance